MLNVVDETVTGCLRTDERSTPRATLAGKNTLPAVALSPVCAKEVSNLASANADVAGGNVCVGPCDLRKSNVHWELNDSSARIPDHLDNLNKDKASKQPVRSYRSLRRAASSQHKAVEWGATPHRRRDACKVRSTYQCAC